MGDPTRIHSDHSADFLSVTKIAGSDWTTIRQRHANGSDEVVGEITLTDFRSLRDLHYLIGALLNEIAAGEAR